MAGPKFTVNAYQGDEPFCFVSYSHDDSEIIFEELQLLSGEGFRVYYDEGIHPGHAWHDDLARAIEKSSLFLLFVTSNSIQSANCLRELNFALDRKKPVLAVHLDDVELPAGLQLALGDRQAIVRSRFEEEVYRNRVFSAAGEHVARVSDHHPDTGKQPVQVAPQNVGAAPVAKPATSNRMPFVVAALALLLSFGFAAFYLYTQQQQETRAQDYEAALDEINALVAQDRYTDAYLVMQSLDPVEDPRRSEYAERIAVPGKFAVETEGVSVSFKPYGRDDVDWFAVGSSPFAEETLYPRGVLQIKLEKEGHETREIVAINPGPMFGNDFYLANIRRPTEQGEVQFTQSPVRVTKPGVVPPEWVEVVASDQPVFLAGWSRDVLGFDIIANTPRFYVQRFEVTNAEYQEFVNAGGYRDPVYWQDLTFRDGDQVLEFEEAMSRFVDKTGRPGPSTWSLSSYAEGEAALPVGGISWFEAAAYARFRDLSLPTVHQWTRYAHGPLEGLYPLAAEIEKQSNLSGTGLQPASSKAGLGPWGTYHTAGNVREWVWNSAGEMGLIQGSSWQSYGNYSSVQTAPRWDRHETNGVRLVQNDSRDPFDTALLAPIDLVLDDPLVSREPVSDEVFAGMRFQFTAPRRVPQDVRIERIEETPLWAVDEHVITYSAEEAHTLYIFTPSNMKPPYQALIYGPPGDAPRPGQTNREAPAAQVRNFDYILRGGRAVVLPIWTWTYERYPARGLRNPSREERLDGQRRSALSFYRDAAFTVNYLESLEDYGTDGLAYMGYSFGAAYFGQLVVALEQRISTAIFVSGGIVHSISMHPMMDSINYVPRITQPVLQLNGVYDHLFPYQESAVRHFELLGSPPDKKKLVSYDAGHIGFPENQLITEISDWLDQELGPVR